jgi:hypothetical protein
MKKPRGSSSGKKKKPLFVSPPAGEANDDLGPFQRQMLNALDVQLEGVARIYALGLPVVLAGYWNAASQVQQVSLAGVELRKDQIFHFVCVAFFFVAAVALMRLNQARDWLRLLGPREAPEALALLGTYPRDFNPFSVADAALGRRARLFAKYFLLTLAWWSFCATLLPQALESPARLGYLAAFLVIGATTAKAILRILRLCESMAGDAPAKRLCPEGARWFADTRRTFRRAVLAGSLAGGGLFAGAWILARSFA